MPMTAKKTSLLDGLHFAVKAWNSVSEPKSRTVLRRAVLLMLER